MVGWDHQLNGHKFEQALGVGDRPGGLVCCSPWGRKVRHDWGTELDWAERAEFESKLLPYPVWPWANYLTYWIPNFLIHKMEMLPVVLNTLGSFKDEKKQDTCPSQAWWLDDTLTTYGFKSLVLSLWLRLWQRLFPRWNFFPFLNPGNHLRNTQKVGQKNNGFIALQHLLVSTLLNLS